MTKINSDIKQNKVDIREAILESTKTIVLEEGWQAVSMRKIADLIGYSLPMVYKSFENKDAILTEFVKHGFAMLNDVMVKAKTKASSPEQQLKEMAFAYYQFAFEQAAYYQLMFGLGTPNCERAKEIIEVDRLTHTITNALEALIIVNSEEKTNHKFYTFWSILHGLTSINMADLTSIPCDLQKQILQDAIEGFIKNINN